ncbi:MAG: hypothetical protein V2A79_05980, partial [Planctomycetota bacterium]
MMRSVAKFGLGMWLGYGGVPHPCVAGVHHDAAIILALWTVTAENARGEDTPPPSTDELSPAAQIAIARGLAWLATQQEADGSFGGKSHYGRHVGITGLAGLAFLSDGNVPGRGRHAAA